MLMEMIENQEKSTEDEKEQQNGTNEVNGIEPNESNQEDEDSSEVRDEFSVPDKREVSGKKPNKAGFLTRQSEWWTWEDLERTTLIDPSRFSIDSLTLKVIWNIFEVFF